MHPGDTILDLKKKVQALDGIAVAVQDISFNGHLLSDAKTISECHIQKGSILNLNLVLKTPIILDIGVFGEHVDAHSRNMLTISGYSPQG